MTFPSLTLGTQPEYFHPAYGSSAKRSPRQALILLPQSEAELSGPVFGAHEVSETDSDLTHSMGGEAIGERIIVHGTVRDEQGRPLPHILVEVWQANATGRYKHQNDQHDAPLDPHFTGCGRMLTDAEGRYRFVTIKPGAYPWRNHHNAWRPAHIHFSLFGQGFLSRLVTQMYFPGDPLLPFDPIFNCVTNERAKQSMVCQFDWAATKPEWALGYHFDIILRGNNATPFEHQMGAH
jgi:protocatechuate 3,4-dioxygenase, beta subunit